MIATHLPHFYLPGIVIGTLNRCKSENIGPALQEALKVNRVHEQVKK